MCVRLCLASSESPFLHTFWFGINFFVGINYSCIQIKCQFIECKLYSSLKTHNERKEEKKTRVNRLNRKKILSIQLLISNTKHGAEVCSLLVGSLCFGLCRSKNSKIKPDKRRMYFKIRNLLLCRAYKHTTYFPFPPSSGFRWSAGYLSK